MFEVSGGCGELISLQASSGFHDNRWYEALKCCWHYQWLVIKYLKLIPSFLQRINCLVEQLPLTLLKMLATLKFAFRPSLIGLSFIENFFFCNLKIWRVTQLIISNIFPIRTCLEQKSIGTGRSEWVNNYSDSAVGRNMTKGSSKHGLFIKQHVQLTLKLDPNLISIWNITIMWWN